jgi:hypothetical protein
MALNGLIFCADHNLNALPCWGKRSLYYEPRHGSNAWNAYFDSRREGDGSIGFTLPYWPSVTAEYYNDRGVSPRQFVGQCIQSFAPPNQEILSKVDDYVTSNFKGDYIVGVHIRGTDAASGFESRTSAKIEQYIYEVEKQLSAHPNARIFLATDDQRIVQTFSKHFGEILILRECIRSSNGDSIHGHYDSGIEGSPYGKGLEVLLDALILARCDFLIRGHSRVTCFSICYASELQYIDVDLEYTGIDRTPWLHAR